MEDQLNRFISVDGNEAAARIAYQLSEIIAIYPITPASAMGELADAWSTRGQTNMFDSVPRVVEMQSEAGAAGVVHGSLQAGALTTTFTASQGLLLMIPNMFKIAGELTPTVFHIAARTLATHALSIFCDHSDVMSARSTGWAMLCSDTVQETHDMALIAHASTLQSRIPFMHFFDGFRTSHEISKIEALTDDDLHAMIDKDMVSAHHKRGLTPDAPSLRGTAQNPDVFFQAREACNPFYDATPEIVQDAMNTLGARTGRTYKLFEYVGHPQAQRVIVMMGSGTGAAEQGIESLVAKGEKVGLVKVRLFRPFSIEALTDAIPDSAKAIAVLDRTKEPGAVGEPLYQDVVTSLAERADGGPMARVIGGRYGLSSKEFTPAMVARVFDELGENTPKRRFTIGINDDVTHLSLAWDQSLTTEPSDEVRALFFGLGSDGTVGANKNSVKIINENTDLSAQGYFVYDSKKSGAVTVSHLRFGPRPINASYLIQHAGFIACHQFNFLDKMDILELAEPGATFLLNSPHDKDAVWDELPSEVQREIIDKNLKFFVIDAVSVASTAGLGRRINTVMQVCFFALSGVLERDEAIVKIKESIVKSYSRHGQSVVRKNLEAVDTSLAAMFEVEIPSVSTSKAVRPPMLPDDVPDFVERVTGRIIAGQGESLPVSALPVDGVFPTATAKYEKRSIAHEIPIWDESICIQCGLCALVCPHAAIRMKVFDPAQSDSSTPDGFKAMPWQGKDLKGNSLSIQVAPDDCTGCSLCVEACPAKSKEQTKHKSINMEPKNDHLDRERVWFDHFLELQSVARKDISLETIKTTQLLEPLFEYSGACAGCGETPYLKLLTQLYGDRLMVANATGCSSIYGGNLPTTPWTCNDEGRGPAWANSLFEDNAEFGLGMRLATDKRMEFASELLVKLRDPIGSGIVDEIINADQSSEELIQAQRLRVVELKAILANKTDEDSRALFTLADSLVRKCLWIVGGDGWAYDIGYSGLDHVLASGHNLNVMVLDTEVYSNTGGQASKSTPRAAIAKFASGGKPGRKKDLGMLAAGYGNVYVAQISMGANPKQSLSAIREAEAYDGPSLVIAYSPCIAHGINMTEGLDHQKAAVASGYWPLYRYDPRNALSGKHPMHLDSRKPKIPFEQFAKTEARFAMLKRANPEHAQRLIELAQRDIDERFRFYEQMAGVERTVPDHDIDQSRLDTQTSTENTEEVMS